MISKLDIWMMYLYSIFKHPLNLSIFIISITLSLLFFYLFIKNDYIKAKVKFLYLHIILLFFPFLFAAFSGRCMSPVYYCSSLIDSCTTEMVYNCSPKFTVSYLFLGVITALILSFIVLPYIYRWSIKSNEIARGYIKDFVKRKSSKLGIREPRIYAIEDIKPLAYSITNIRPSVFITVGLCELLNRKELEAVLLHELYHLKNKASFWKFSLNMLRLFTPLATFISTRDSLNREEKRADIFAINIQGSERYINSAKRKIELFEL